MKRLSNLFVPYLVCFQHFPPSATTLHFEFYPEDAPTAAPIVGATAAPTATISGANPPSTSKPKGTSNPTSVIHMPSIDSLDKTPAQIMDQLLTTYAVPKDKQVCLRIFRRCLMFL